MRIAIQGALGSFHHEAAQQLIPHATVVPKQTFADVFRAVRTNEVDYGLCAIENTIYGPIEEIYELLQQEHVWLLRDVQLQIAQHLIGPKMISLEELANSSDVRVLSQAPALAQAEHWLALHLPKAAIETTHDTAASVQAVVALGQPHVLAIAGRLAASTYGGTIVAEDIQNNPNNFTRFILCSHEQQSVKNTTPTWGSLILKTSKQPNTLTSALQVFADAHCSPTRLINYSSNSDASKHAYYIDYPLPPSGSSIIVKALQDKGYKVKLLGEFSSAPLIHTS